MENNGIGKKPKHRLIYEHIHSQITAGLYAPGQRLPSEAELTRRFETSRPTVVRALRDLQHQGLLERRAGSGSYVRQAQKARSSLFGLLVPGLGQRGIFNVICAEMARVAHTSDFTLLWGSVTEGDLYTRNRHAEEVCQQYIATKVAGVFFAPLELTPEKDPLNERIAMALARASIPVVLLDRDIYKFPRRSEFDLVGIDNRRAGHMVARHLLGMGCRQIEFVALPGSAPTVADRIQGYQEALAEHGITPDEAWVHLGDSADPAFVRQLMRGSCTEAFICANDDTAAALMANLMASGVRIPEDVRVVGFDDANEYATLFSVPLTTLHQPCRHLGAVAVSTMLERIADPDLPPREVRLDFRLVVRESCGAKLKMMAEQPHG